MDSITFFQVVANSLLARKCFFKNPTLAIRKDFCYWIVKKIINDIIRCWHLRDRENPLEGFERPEEFK